MSENNASERDPGAADLNALFESLAERLGRSARAAAIFGEPVESEGVTVIPVARARWGMGGGSGRRRGQDDTGVGGGGGAVATPVGYIEIRGGESRFRPIVDLKALLGFGLAAAALLLVALRHARE